MARTIAVLSLLAAACALVPSRGAAQEERPGGSVRPEVARQLQNPLPDLMSVQALNDVDLGIGDGESLLLQRFVAFLPMRLTTDVNLVVWTVLPVRSVPPIPPRTERLNGMGDVLHHMHVSPARAGRHVWGIGPALQLPTATKRDLGSGVFSIGPSAALVYQSGRWTASVQAWHLHSVTSGTGRARVERTHVQPSVARTFASGTTLGLSSETIVPWRAAPGEGVVVPLLLTLGQVTEVGSQSLSLVLGGRYYVVAPDAGPVWGTRFAVAMTFPITRDDHAGDGARDDATDDVSRASPRAVPDPRPPGGP